MSRYEQDHRELDFNTLSGFGAWADCPCSFEGDTSGEDETEDYSDILAGIRA